MGKIDFDIYETPHAKRAKQSYHVRITNSELLDFEKVKKRIADQSTATLGDVSLVVEQLSKIIANEIGMGNRVHIEGIGYFSIGIETDPTSNAKSINATKVRVRGPQFIPDKKLQSSLTDISFVRSKIKRHSASTTYEEKQVILKDYFKTHASINRLEFQKLLGLTKETAIRRIHEFCEKPYVIFIKEGANNSPYYLPDFSSPFWK
jgi:predicted histone-like DNA-binding protein